MTENGSLLRLADVDTYYGEINILRRVSLEVGSGELVCLLGTARVEIA